MDSAPIEVGSLRHLFLDDHVIDRTDNVQRQLHRPVRQAENPLLTADEPWEQDGYGVLVDGGTVIYDEEDKIFKMWYRAFVAPERGKGKAMGNNTTTAWGTGVRVGTLAKGGYKACYAVSNDGLDWERPNLGLAEYGGSTRNNILPPAIDQEGSMYHIRRPNLIKDYEEVDPDKRYKMVYMDNIGDKWVLSKAYSPDGIRWRMNVGSPTYFQRPVAPNGILFGWDPRLERYVHFHRKGGQFRADVDGRQTRAKLAVMRSTSPDFDAWGDTREVLSRDRNDPPRWNPSHGADLAAALYTDEIYIGFVDTCTSHWVEDLPQDLWDSVGQGEFADYRTELIYSRDGAHWKRIAPHWEFLAPGLWGTWDSDHVMLAKPIVRNDEVWLYYTAGNVPLKANIPEHPQRRLLNQVIDGQRMGHAIGLAKIRLDGFASMEGYDPEGTLTTHPLLFQGDRLLINARAPKKPFGSSSTPRSPYGQLRVEVLDRQGRPLEGFGASDCDAFSGDEVRHPVTWKGNDGLVQLAETPIRLRFYLKNAALYSFQFTGKDTKPGMMNLLEPGSRGHP